MSAADVHSLLCLFLTAARLEITLGLRVMCCTNGNVPACTHCNLQPPLQTQEEHQEALQGRQLAAMRALLEQQVLPETAAVLATADKNAREIPSSGKERVVPKILVPLVKVSRAQEDSGDTISRSPGCLAIPTPRTNLL